MSIGEKIKERRLQLNMSQDELANKLGYSSRSSINKIELGINDITQSKVKDFADALQTTPAFLMEWEEEKEDDISFDDFRFALYGEVKDLTEGQKEDLLNFARFLKSNNK
ncbi:MAG: helix-turn-helix domain-containing protein [Anaerorhabdus sp.]|uniref:helix-turn-helix domain-containing protein n=1 Tax=Anaerorhabdus sp. TaxID=1872524 RepID=UPI003A8517C4